LGLSIDVVRHISFTDTRDYRYPSSSASFRIASLDAVDVERGETLAGDAVSLLLPFFSCLEDSSRLRGILTPARLFGAGDDGLPVVLLRALASVAVIFECFSYPVIGAVFLTARGERRGSTGRGVTLDLTANHASASGAWVVNDIEFLANVVGQSLVLATAGILATFHLSIWLALASVALFLNFGSQRNGLTIVLTITGDRVV